MNVIPLQLKDANEYVLNYHRHHGKVCGHKFSIGAVDQDILVGVAIVSRPVSRINDDGMTMEVSRLCTCGHKNVCSFLYAACARICREMGYKKIITYISEEEPGTSLIACGWNLDKENCGGRNWNCKSRPRTLIQKNLFGEDEKYIITKRKRFSKILK